jgi:hypothetical protein
VASASYLKDGEVVLFQVRPEYTARHLAVLHTDYQYDGLVNYGDSVIVAIMLNFNTIVSLLGGDAAKEEEYSGYNNRIRDKTISLLIVFSLLKIYKT